MKTLEVSLTDDQCDMLQKIAEDRGGRIDEDEDAEKIIQVLVDQAITAELILIGMW